MSAAGSERKDFIYTGQRREDIPKDVTHVKLHPSVKVIGSGAFADCSRLTNVELHDGLVTIEYRAFYGCTSLLHIVIPPSIKVIDGWVFAYCLELTNVELCTGLEKIGGRAFYNCRSLNDIVIPPSVKVIGMWAFAYCSELTNVELCNGLEKIEFRAFSECTSLHDILIPPSVTEIGDMVFKNCSELTHVQFCDDIEGFVSGESMQDWWNHGVHEKSLRTYCFFARCNIPERVGLVQARKWQNNIHEMLGRIPAIYPRDLDAHFGSIDSKLSVYINLRDAPVLLEHAIYRNNGILNVNTDDILNTDIVPRVLSYLTDG